MSCMLSQRSTSLCRASSSAMTPPPLGRRALSTSWRLQRPLMRFFQRTTPQLHCQLQPHRLSPRHLSRPSLFHSSTFHQAPAASSPPEELVPAASTPSAPQKPDFLNEAESHIWDLLVKDFSPVELVVQDISGGCGSMYGIEIASEKFRGANMLKQQRMVNAALGDLLKGWHGCQLKTRVP